MPSSALLTPRYVKIKGNTDRPMFCKPWMPPCISWVPDWVLLRQTLDQLCHRRPREVLLSAVLEIRSHVPLSKPHCLQGSQGLKCTASSCNSPPWCLWSSAPRPWKPANHPLRARVCTWAQGTGRATRLRAWGGLPFRMVTQYWEERGTETALLSALCE